nr:zinc finger, CCHC-type [Tanacetum cinerariifolium]
MGIVKKETRWRRESAASRLQSLMIGFQTLQMKEDDTMDAFTAKLNGYATKAKELGKTLDESLLLQKLLDSTPDRFIQIVASKEQTNDLDDITLDEIVRKLKAFEERIKLQKEGQVESQENLLFAHGEHSRKGRRFSKRRGRSNFSRGNWQRNDSCNNQSGLVQKPSSSTSYVPPTRNDWDLLFQPLFDELLNPPPSVNNQHIEVIAPIAEVISQDNDDSTGSPSSTAVDQDAPSPSELRAISGHMLEAAKVQIPENNLDNLHSSREEDGTLEIVDP